MTFHVTIRERSGALRVARVGGEGATPSAARRDAIRSAASRYGVASSAIVSAVAIPRPRAVTSYPEALTPGQG